MKRLWKSALSLLQGSRDEELMLRVKATDDHEQFGRLVKKWEEPVRRLCTRLTGDSGRGEELKQEAFLKLFQHRRDYEPSARFSTFLWRIALNLCRDEFRRQERRRQFSSSELKPSDAEEALSEAPSEAPGPDTHAAAAEERELVRLAVGQLPEIYRTVIVLRHYEDLKLAQIAEILEIPEGTVNSRMAEALTRLSRTLQPKLKPTGTPQLPFTRLVKI